MVNEMLLTADEVAGMLKLEAEEVSALVNQGALGAHRFPNGQLRFSPAHIRAFLQETEMNLSIPATTITASGGLLSEVRDFVAEVIRAKNIQRGPHVTDEVLKAIKAEWFPRYVELTQGRGNKIITINQLIGRSTAELMGMQDSGTRQRSKSGLAATYTILR